MSDRASTDAATNSDSPGEGPSWPKRIGKIVAAVAILATLLFLARQAGDRIPQFAEWVESLGFWGPLVFAVGYVIATVLLIPGSLLTLAGGALFGLAKGTAVVFVGATVGACLAFLIARYAARAAVEKRVEQNEKFDTIDKAVGKQGRKIVFLLRLTPALPFTLLNYALGLTKVRFIDYLLACAGMLPGTLLYVYYGKVAGDISKIAAQGGVEKDAGSYVLLGVGLVAAIVVTALVTRIARRALKDAAGEEVAES